MTDKIQCSDSQNLICLDTQSLVASGPCWFGMQMENYSLPIFFVDWTDAKDQYFFTSIFHWFSMSAITMTRIWHEMRSIMHAQNIFYSQFFKYRFFHFWTMDNVLHIANCEYIKMSPNEVKWNGLWPHFNAVVFLGFMFEGFTFGANRLPLLRVTNKIQTSKP